MSMAGGLVLPILFIGGDGNDGDDGNDGNDDDAGDEDAGRRPLPRRLRRRLFFPMVVGKLVVVDAYAKYEMRLE